MKKISVVIPIYNEESNIKELYSRLEKVLLPLSLEYELVFINDGSTDSSLKELILLSDNDKNVFYINLSRNFGHQIALSAGLDICSGDCVVIMDGDLQDPPETVRNLLDKYEEGYDVVYAKRIKREGESFLKKITAKLFYRILKRIIPFDIPLDTGDFRLLSRKVVNELKNMPEKSKFLRGQVAWLGFKSTEVLFERDKRRHGTTNYSYGKMIVLALDAITGFSDKPLRLVSRFGFIVSSLTFIIILFAIFSHFVLQQTITGWTSLIISSMFIGGIQLLSVGVICEYLARMNKDIKNRPLYIIEDTNFIL